jgi:hypothetical protein
VSYEPEPREGQRRVWRRLTRGAGDSGGATVLDSGSEASVNRGGRWRILRHRTDEREVRRYFNADRETERVELPVMTTVGVRNLTGGNGGPTAGSDRRSMGVRWGVVRAFCERIGMRGKWDSGDDRRPL